MGYRLPLRGRKKKGTLGRMMTSMFGLLVSAFILALSTMIPATLKMKEDINMVSRRYILLMEVNGGLIDSTDEGIIGSTGALKSDLEKIGVTSVSTVGSTLKGTVAYGDQVTLQIDGKVKMETFVAGSGTLFGVERGLKEIDLNLPPLKSTAKH